MGGDRTEQEGRAVLDLFETAEVIAITSPPGGGTRVEVRMPVGPGRNDGPRP